MAIEFKDFTYSGNKLSDLNTKYISVDFEQNPDTVFALSRNIEYNDTNRFRHEPTITPTRFDDKLSFELHLVKDDTYYKTQEERLITEGEVRELTRWLTSTDTSQLLEFDYGAGSIKSGEDVHVFFGQFINIEPFNMDGSLYGLKMTFECSSAFGYTDQLTDTIICAGNAISYNLSNQDDRLNEYCYPEIEIRSKKTGDIYFCNLSDCKIHKEGVLVAADAPSFYLEQLVTQIADYGLEHGLTPIYDIKDDGVTRQTICNNTAIQFRYIDSDNSSQKCIACYSVSTRKFYILRGGFLYLKVKKDLPILLHSERLFIFDESGNMIKFTEIGIRDIDYMYWPRLANGTNTLLLWGEDCTFLIRYRETRKVGV